MHKAMQSYYMKCNNIERARNSKCTQKLNLIVMIEMKINGEKMKAKRKSHGNIIYLIAFRSRIASSTIKQLGRHSG